MMLLMPHILAWRHHLQPCQSKMWQQHWVGRGSGVTVLVRQASKVRLQLLFSIIYWHNRCDEKNFSSRRVIWIDSNVTRRDPSLVMVFRVHQQPRPPFLSRFEWGRADSAHHCPRVSRQIRANTRTPPPRRVKHARLGMFYVSGCLLPIPHPSVLR